MSSPVVEITSTQIILHLDSVAEAKLAIKELKLKKKEVALERKQVAAQQQAIRAAYTDKKRRQGSMVRGGGGMGRFFRNVQQIGRDADKRQLASQLAPLDQHKAICDAMLHGIDQSILNAEAYILKSSKQA